MDRRLTIAGLIVSLLLQISPGHAADSFSGPADLYPLLQAQTDALESLSDNSAATALFVTKLAPSLGLHDVAATLTAKGIPATMAQELGVPELISAAQRLVASLAAWQVADQAVRSMLASDGPAKLPGPVQREWIRTTVQLPAWAAFADSKPESDDRKLVAGAANQLAQDARQQALTDWWTLKTWKDRVRTARGRMRLCGTWQWVIHNHKNHQEQKVSMLFPPQGQEKTAPYLPAEILVLGDVIYLRWETEGRVQEDSLLFIKDGTRLEGSFINNTGGWGSITGKRTSDCRP